MNKTALVLSGLAWAVSTFTPMVVFAGEPATTPTPPLAPFTSSGDSALPPPAPAPADLSLPPPESGPEAGIEERFRILQAKQTVSTASKREQSINDVPLTISAIPAEELDGTGRFTLCDAIQYFPGLECRRGAMRKAAVSVRGLGSNFLSNRMLLLIDGRPATDPWTGQFYADETTPMTNLKQIEVIRGPGSSLYGSNAFSGVINLITRGPDDLMKDGRKYGVDLRAMAGMYGTYRAEATAAGQVGPVKALINYYGYYTDGPQLLNDAKQGVVDKQEWAQVHQVTGKLQVKSVGVDVGYTWSNEGRPGGLADTPVGNCGRCHYTANDKEKVEQFFINGHVDQKVTSWLRLYGQVYANFKRREVSLFNEIVKEDETTLGKRRRVGAEARALFNYRWFNLTIGGDVKFDVVNDRNILTTLTPSQVTENIYGVFLDAEVRPINKLILGAGVRYDYYDIPTSLWARRSSEVSPRASIIYHALKQLSLRANYGRAFRAPSLVELAISQQMYAATLLGNPYLKPETVDTAELAIDVWPWKEYLRLSAGGFYNRATNLINEQHIAGSTSQFNNIGAADVAGFEVEAGAQIPQIAASFDVAYQYLFTHASETSEGRSGPLDYAAPNRLYLRAHKRFGFGGFVDFYGIYVGARKDDANTFDPATGAPNGRVTLPGYFVANARVGADVYKGLQASLIATNLFDAKYQEMLGFPAPGISVFGELRYSH